MAEVKIDLHAMAELVSALTSARSDATDSVGLIRGYLTRVWLSAPGLDKVSALDAEINTALRDLNRRLSLARVIAQSTPGLSVVTFDDKVLSTADDAEVQRRVAEVLKMLDVDDGDLADKDFDVIDPDVLKLLSQNSLDPYFAKALAAKVDPAKLADYLKLVNQGRSAIAIGQADGDVDDYDAKYRSLLDGLGQTLGLASRGTGDLSVPGMAEKWAKVFSTAGDTEPPNSLAGNALSLVISRGEWSADFLAKQYRGMREGEQTYGGKTWGINQGDVIRDPFADSDDNEVIDATKGLFIAMQSTPGAIRQIFTGGETTEVDTGNGKVKVNKELYEFLHDRENLDEGSIDELMKALGAGIGSPPVAGQKAWQPMLALDLKNIGEAFKHEADEAAKERGPLWKQIVHGVLDVVGLIPIIGEPADFVNGVWYYADGDIINGSLSMGSAVPFAGWAFAGGKWVKRALSAEELLKVDKLAKDGKLIQLFSKDGKLLSKADLADPRNFDPDRFLTPAELARYSGDREFMRKIIAGNRFNAYMNAQYDFAEVAIESGGKYPFRVDAYSPGRFIVSRKLTQFSQIEQGTAFRYIDEFAKKYKEGTKIRVTDGTKKMVVNGRPIAGTRLRGEMRLEVPPQLGQIDDAVLQRAVRKNIHIVDSTGKDYTKPLYDALKKGKK